MSATRQQSGSGFIVAIGVLAIAVGATFVVISQSRKNRPNAAPVNPGPGQVETVSGIAPHSVAVLKTKDQLAVTVGVTNAERGKLTGTLGIEIVDPNGKVLAKESKKIEQADPAASYRFNLPATKTPLEEQKLRLTFKDDTIELMMNEALVAKAHETSVAAGGDLHVGTSAALRCGVHSVKSISETVPLTGASVEVQLKDKAGKSVDLYKGKAGGDGTANVAFQVPDLPPGQYTLVILTKSELGDEKLERAVNLKAESKILLVTDKPLYQPGQDIHIRALALRPIDLKPLGKEDLTIEVEDSKGNKVFKRTVKTSEYGIAAVDFQLADEVNMGGYQIRAILGQEQAAKSVEVKKYVLPKFKATVTADKPFYLPKETIHATLQADYFFGKPVANSKVQVKASTFDVAFKDFATWEGKTDANGAVKFEIKLPDYFVGQPLAKGNALVKLEVKLTDTADHAETINKTYTVSDQPIKLTLIPEGGRLLPQVENRVFVAAIYPDGSPAKADVKLWLSQKAEGNPYATLKTNESGLTELKITPEAKQFRTDNNQFEQRNIEMLGGQIVQTGGPKVVLDITAQAADAKGNKAQTTAGINAEPYGDNVLIRLDKAIYKGGESMQVDVHSSTGTPTAYVDIIRGGQVLLSKWLDVKDGKASRRLDLPASVFGTLEVHAYQMLSSGVVVRDSRVVYVHPPTELKIDIKADREVYQPGQDGKIRFQVTDANGKPVPAALGVIIVDEAVYALQEMQPGLEKVFFTLQEELLKPQVEVHYKPSEPIDILVREQALPPAKQQIAQAILASVRPKPPQRWEVAPAIERKQRMEGIVQQVGFSLLNYAQQDKPVISYDEKAKKWAFRTDLLKELVTAKYIDPSLLLDPLGGTLDLAKLGKLKSEFTPDSLAKAVTSQRMQQLTWMIANHANQNQAKFFKNKQWDLPESIVADAAKQNRGQAQWSKDAWGTGIKIVKSDKKRVNQTGQPQFDHHELVSAGPDRQFGTADDVKLDSPVAWQRMQFWWADEGADDIANFAQLGQQGGRGGFGDVRFKNRMQNGMMLERAGAVPQAAFAPGGARPEVARTLAAGMDPKAMKEDTGGGSAPALRIREYFPETMLWRPALITDDKGVAELPVSFADSITTWRLTASANSAGGLLGGVNAPLRVFQDFFVDIDLPVSLTLNDEVAFPVAVYNYMKEPQTVRLELQPEPWFEMLDAAGSQRELKLQAGEVTAVKFRIKAKKVGQQPLLVKAVGTKLSDGIRRSVEIVPDGQKREQVVTDRLQGSIKHTLTIPQDAQPDASKLIVKIYPGIMSQVVEGLEGMMRMPGGCMEQTSSSNYPNILVVDYIKKSRLANPAMLAKAEQYLNGGYQRMLTFERPGGGFDWWGKDPPIVWISAYALHQFNDMSKVWPIDKGIIDRTQAWLISQQNADGSWDKIGATHGETIASMGNAKLLLTSYVTWSLLDSGMTVEKVPQLEKAIAYIRVNTKDAGDNAYVLALAANALAAHDAKDDRTFEVLKKLESLKVTKPEWKAVCFPAQATSLAYSRGDSVTIETTALTVLAMIRSGQFNNSVNQGLTYLIKSKDGSGTWGSTQATILALKALISGVGGPKQEGEAKFTILVNGKEAGRGVVNAQNADVLQMFDLKDVTKVGDNDVEIKVEGTTNLMYQIVGRHFESWRPQPPEKPTIEVSVDYDRTELTTNDLLRAKATLKYHGQTPTYMVMLDLGIAPGFTVDPGDFAEMVGAKKVEKFSITSRQIILYLGDIKPGDVKTFEYTLKPKYPIKAKTPASVAYEYNTPAIRATAQPVEIKVVEKK